MTRLYSKIYKGRLRIVYYVQSAEYGGAERVCVQELCSLDPIRYDPVLVCPQPLFELIKDELPEWVNHVPFAFSSNYMNSLLEPHRVLSLARLFWRLHADVLHVHNQPAKYTGRAANLLSRIPVVIVTEHLAPQPAPWTARKSRMTRTRSYLYWSFFRWQDRFFARYTHKILGTSRAVTNYVTQVIGIPEDIVRVLYPGIELKNYPFAPKSDESLRNELGLSSTAPILAVIARLDPVKGLDYLLRAMPIVLRDQPEAVLLVVGDGDQREHLNALADRLGLCSNVRFLGFQRDLLRIYTNIDLNVLPSLSEALGLSLLEAMAVGVPSIGTSVGGIPELIIHGETGYLVPPKDPDALAMMISHALSHPDELASIRRNARNQIEVVYSAENRSRTLMTIIEEAVADSCQSRSKL